MSDLAANLPILWPALVAGLLVMLSHVPLGQQVLRRGIVFIDLAIAQVAGVGVIAAHGFGLELEGWKTQLAAVVAALLAALGVLAGTSQEVEDSIRAAESGRWRAVVPPAMVVREEAAPWTIRLNLPAAEVKSALVWRLTEESGARREGALHPASIEVAARPMPTYSSDKKTSAMLFASALLAISIPISGDCRIHSAILGRFR